ncbi:MAG: polyketide synthase [Gammaproteobacteria bacterium]|nr:polyketide synthase [Gammaproteobacteria bacterium]|tara:strand:+ start:3734 stop:4531 length:798 start_codon:yes stop_codon:yes gene_type:complete
MSKYALVTGASSGIGLEVSKNLAANGYNLVLTARRTDLLNDLANNIENQYGVDVDLISKDLSLYDSPKEIYEFCESKNYDINLLVNNAGYGIKTAFHNTSIEDEEDFIRVLGTSVIMLTKLFLPKMIENGDGKIMIVSSVASFAAPSAIQPLYGPIKTFMNRFSDSININYKHKGITSTSVCPGFTVTGFHSASGVQEQMDRVPKFMVFSAERIAKEAVDATLAGKSLCVPTKTYKFLVFMLKNIPQSILRLIGAALAPGRYDRD